MNGRHVARMAAVGVVILLGFGPAGAARADAPVITRSEFHFDQLAYFCPFPVEFILDGSITDMWHSNNGNPVTESMHLPWDVVIINPANGKSAAGWQAVLSKFIYSSDGTYTQIDTG